MLRSLAIAVIATVTGLGVATGNVMAQACYNAAGDGSGPSRDAAMRQAYENALRKTDPAAAGMWASGNRPVGDAPGYSVRKLTNKCVPGGSGQICHIDAILCRN